MKPEDAKREDGRAFEIRDIELKEHYLSANYTVDIAKLAVLSDTGRLTIMTFKPLSTGLPEFSVRWDGGSREPGKTERHDVDIDIIGVSPGAAKLFKRAKGGFLGHHTERADIERWEYALEVEIPGHKIFEGTVAFQLLRRLTLDVSTKAEASLGMVVKRADGTSFSVKA